MNVAILIGVPTYTSQKPLPACVHDVAKVKQLLDATGKYEKILSLTTNTISSKVKDSLRGFFKDPMKDVEEVFFYFSGHGTYHEDDVLLCCSDFDDKRPKSTSITNSEVDDLLRSVNPKLAVKVLDACRSGLTYIKDTEDSFEKTIKANKASLKAFICMASSMLDQSSWAGPDASIFTSRFVEGALQRDDGDILYRDIQAHLADSFLNVGPSKQTPHFVNQGTGLEKFATVTPAMRALKTGVPPGNLTKTTGHTLLGPIQDTVEQRDSLYIAEVDVANALEKARKSLCNAGIADEVVSAFYDRSAAFDLQLKGLPNVEKVAEFADTQNWRSKYLITVEYERRSYRTLRNPMAAMIGVWTEPGDEDYVTKTRSVPISIGSTHGLPFETIRVDYAPRGHPSLKSFALFVGIVHSRVVAQLLFAFVPYIAIGWDEVRRDTAVEWKTETLTWKEVSGNPECLWKKWVQTAEGQIREYLESLVKKEEPPKGEKPKDDAKPTKEKE